MTVIGGGVIGGGGPQVLQYVYIDGAHLRRAADDFAATYFGGDSIIMTILQMSGQGCLRKYYYDCPPPRPKNESDEDFAQREATEQLFKRLQRMEGCHVYLGETVGVGGKLRQKGVDVQLATHMLTHSFRKTVRRAVLIAGDGDFVPLVRALVEEGTYVTLMSRRSNTSTRLIDAADVHRPFDPFEILGFVNEPFRQKHAHYKRWASANLV
jgi:uncharacterized LabA/DUF88 family protein